MLGAGHEVWHGLQGFVARREPVPKLSQILVVAGVLLSFGGASAEETRRPTAGTAAQGTTLQMRPGGGIISYYCYCAGGVGSCKMDGQGPESTCSKGAVNPCSTNCARREGTLNSPGLIRQ